VRIIFSICELQEVSKGKMAVRVLAANDSGLGNKMVMFIAPRGTKPRGPRTDYIVLTYNNILNS
jgi:hypothetical protein